MHIPKSTLIRVACASAALLALNQARADYSNAVMSLNPAAYWPLNETNATPAADVAINLGTLGAAANGYYVTNAINHTVGGATADFDSSAQFLGTVASFVWIPRASTNTVIQGAFSVECSINQNTSVAGNGIVTGGKDNDLASSVYSGWALEQAGSGAVRFLLYNRNGITAQTTLTSPALSLNAAVLTPAPNTWHHLVATVDGTLTARLYVDGELAAWAANVWYIPNISVPLKIASNGSIDATRYNGYIDEVAIYTNALSSAEVATHYTAGKTGTPVYQTTVLAANPPMYYRLDEPTYSVPSPSSYAVATNYGTVGASANGAYQPGTTPGVAGPNFSGFGAANYACAFNGINALVDCGNPTGVLAPTGSATNAPFSIACWFKCNPSDWRFQGLVGRGDSHWRVSLAGNQLAGNVQWNSGIGGDFNPATPYVNDGNWHFAVAVITTNNTRSLYIDNALAGTPATVTGTYGAATNLVIGGAPDYLVVPWPGHNFNQVRYFAGTMCQVAFFTNFLTATDVSNLWNAAGIRIRTQPASVAVVTGNGATLSVSAQGPGTLGYQWYNGVSALLNATNPSYTISSAGGGDVGNYTVVVTNATDVLTSAVAAVSVVSAPATTYASTLLGLGPVGYWPLTETANSTIAVNYGSLGVAANGAYQRGTTPGVAGPTAAGFGGATTACQFQAIGGLVDCGTNLVMVPTNRAPMSFVAWFKGPTDFRFQGLAGHGDNYWRSSFDITNRVHFNPGAGTEMIGSPILNDGNWHTIAGVSDGNSESLYIDGVLNTTNVASAISSGSISVTMARAVIGGAPDYTTNNTAVPRFFAGSIAQVAFFTNALAGTTISNLAAAAQLSPYLSQQPAPFSTFSGYSARFSVVAGGSPTLAYQWYKGSPGSASALTDGGAVSGSLTPALAFSTVAVSDSTNFFVVVTNGSGAVTSSVVALTVQPTAALPGGAYASTVLGLSPAPVAYWPLNETVAPPAPYYATNLGTYGTSLNGIYCTWWQPLGASFYASNSIFHVPGVTSDGDTAAAFGITGQYLSLPHSDARSVITAPFSVEAWVYPTATPSGNLGVVSQARNNIGGASLYKGFWLGCSGTTWVFSLYNTNGQTSQEIDVTNMTVAAWNHLVGTFDGTNATLYVNASTALTSNGANPKGLTPNPAGQRFVPDDNSPFLIGCLGTFNAGLMPAYIDEVAIYTNALSATDVANHYTLVGSTYTGAVLSNNPAVYLRLDEPAYTPPAVSTFPIATNYGTIGSAANGVYQPGTVPGITGPAGGGFSAGNRGVAINGLAGVDVGGGNLLGNAPELNRTITNAQSVVAWFKGPVDAGRLQSIVGHGDPGWRLTVDTSSLNRFNPGNGTELIGTTRPENDGAWHMVAGVANGTNDFLYIDGVQQATGTHGSVAGAHLDVLLGGDPMYTTPGANRYFLGSIAQVAYFTNSLSGVTVSNLYSTAALPPFLSSQPASWAGGVGLAPVLAVTAGGSPPLIYQWYKGPLGSGTPLSNGGNLAGTTNASLSISPAGIPDNGSYYVVVTNAGGAVTSIVATVSLYAAPTTIYAQNVLGLNPLGYWPLNETAAPPAPYYATNIGSLGTSLNAIYVTWYQTNGANAFVFSNTIGHVTGATADDSDTAMGCGNVGQYVTLPHSDPRSIIKAPFSVEAWVQVTNNPAGNVGVVSQARNNINGVATYKGFWLGTLNSNWVFALYNTNGVTGQEIDITNSIGLNTWTHLVGTFDGTNAALYVNATTNFTSNGANPKTLSTNRLGLCYVPDDNSPFLIGSLGNFNNGRLPGYVDEVAIYTNALTWQQVSNHFLAQNSGYKAAVLTDSPLLYYRLDEPAYTAPDPSTFPAATNYGSIGLSANGAYWPGGVPAVAGPTNLGFGGASLGWAVNGMGMVEIGHTNILVNAPGLNPTFGSAFSVVTWFKGPVDSSGRFQHLLGHADSGWRLGLNTTAFNTFNAGNQGADTASTSRPIADGNWHMVAAVVNNTSSLLYIDGVQQGSATVTSIPGDAIDVLLGGSPQFASPGGGTSGSRTFLGGLAHSAYFGYALSAAQVQQVYNGAGTPPSITTQPVAFSGNGGGAATNSVVASGYAPFSYLWYKNTNSPTALVAGAGNVVAATNLLILNPLATDASDATTYFVIVTNAFGSVTSSVVALTVNTSPRITQDITPPAAYRFAGGSAAFSVGAAGALPLSYQWKTNGGAVLNATNPTVTLTNLLASVSVLCSVTNTLGQTNSSTAAVVVVAPAPYAAAVAADQPLGYWRLGETNGPVGNNGATAYEWINSFNGMYTNTQLGVTGVNVDDADTAARFGSVLPTNSFVAAIPTNVTFATPSPNNGLFSVECWVKGGAQTVDAGIVTKGAGGAEAFNLDCGSSGISHGFRWYARNAAGAGNVNANGTVAPDGNWHHLVGVCSQTNGALYLYVDGVANATGTLTTASGILSTATPMSIGSRLSPTGAYDNQFNGIIDEVAVYNYPLSPSQVQTHFLAGHVGPQLVTQPVSQTRFIGSPSPLVLSVTAGGSAPLGYQWYNGVTTLNDVGNITGSKSNVLTLAPIGGGDSGNYFVVVSNVYATVTSSVAVVSIVAAPAVSYVQGVTNLNPVGFWRLDETNNPAFTNNRGVVANDYWGGHYGIYNNVDLQQPGYSALDPNTAGSFASLANSSPTSYVSSVTGVDFAVTNANAAFSVEAWVKAGVSQVGGAAVVAKGYNLNEQFCLDYNGAGGQQGWRFFIRSAAAGIPSYVANSLSAPDGNWHHLVGVCDQLNTNVSIYVDSIKRASVAITNNAGLAGSTFPVVFGSRQTNAAGVFGFQLNGTIDDVAIYNFALSPSQIQSHYYAAGIAPFFGQPYGLTNTTVFEGTTATFYAGASGTPPLAYQWYDENNGLLTDQTNSTLVLPNVTLGMDFNADFNAFFVVVTNNYGSATAFDHEALLHVVSGVPNITADLSATPVRTYGGRATNLTVGVSGTPPFNYQWMHAGTNIADNGDYLGAHSNVLALLNPQLGDSGAYQLFLTNAYGNTNSAIGSVLVQGVVQFNTNGVGWWTLNGGATLASEALTLTTGTSQGRSAFYAWPQSMGAFVANFVYQDVGATGSHSSADGAVFVVHNDPRGPSALGGTGGSMGWGSPTISANFLTNAVGLEFNIFNDLNHGGIGIALATNGFTGNPNNVFYTNTAPVDIDSGNPIAVSLVYMSGVLQVALTDTVASTFYATNFLCNIQSVVGAGNPAGTAYVGLTGGSGGFASHQVVSNFEFVPLTGLSVQHVGSSVLFAWPAIIGGYTLQSTPSLSSPSWSDVPASVNLVGGQNQVIVTPSSAQYYRLHITLPY